jgi:sulfatase maturation enzyme AslB (radical SAM superfamily)
MDAPTAAAGEPTISQGTDPVGDAVREGTISGRLWLYANYHCNLTCDYCLTESAPNVPARELGADRMRSLVEEAAGLGFSSLGVTGGEPFLLPYLPELVADLSQVLPVVVLTNGTLFTPHRLARLAQWAELPIKLQISLDRPDPVANDSMRGPENFRKVVDSVPRLIDKGIGVRIATTLEAVDPEELKRLCRLHRQLGVLDEDHVVRPIVRRGRARLQGLGQHAGPVDLEPELTITADGAFWSPFAPTVTGGRLDTDLLVTRQIAPLRVPAEAMVRMARAWTRFQSGIRFR